MRNCRLLINIDHSATLRNAREGLFPDPLEVAKKATSAGADGTTFHLREDRRHIKDDDALRITASDAVGITCMEMAMTNEMCGIACRLQPNRVCLVPEKRAELTTEGGLSIAAMKHNLAEMVDNLHTKQIVVSVFVDPDPAAIQMAASCGADAIEIHTGHWADSVIAGNADVSILQDIKDCSKYAQSIGLEVHAGHGLTFDSVEPIAQIDEISEISIGHFIICQSVFTGIENTVQTMKTLIQNSRNKLN